MWLTRFSISRPIIVSMLFIALAIYGVFAFFQIGRSLNPNVTFPIVAVSASYPGASPAEMERLVIKPIEDQIDGIDNLDQMSATAEDGLAVVIVQFKIDTNLDYAAIDVQRRVDTARVYMPTDLDPPLVDKSAGSQQAPIVTLALSSKTLAATALSDLVAQRIVPDIRHVPNVQSVDVNGDVKREFHVLPDPLRLLGTGATVSDIFNAINQNNANVPGGRLEAPNAETDVSVHSDIVRASDMLGIPLPILSATTGLAGGPANGLKVGDVATTEDGHVEQRVISKFNGAPTMVLDVNRVITSDEIKSTEVLRDRLKAIEARYPTVHFEEVAAAADYTQKSLDGVLQSLLEGIVLTAVVLMLFLHAWRNALVVMIAIPSSLLSTFIVMKQLHFTLDIVSLMGVSLIIGILVDDSIVVLENITRHRDMGQSPTEAALSGRGEIGGAAVAITLVDVVVFLPIAFLSGIVGKYMIEFGIVVVVATLFSLLVSFTLTPMLAARWSIVKRSAEPPPWLAWFQRDFDRLTAWYRDRALPYALQHRWQTVGVCVALLVSALALPVLGLVQSEFIPSASTGSIQMTLTYHPGTPIGATVAAADRIDAAIMKLPYVHSTLSTVGTKPAGWGQTTGGHVANMTVELEKDHRAATNDVVKQIRNLAYLVPGGVLTVSAEGGGGSGGDPVFYTLSGPEDQIQGGADKLAAVIRAIPGTVNVQTGAESETDRLNINIDRAKCAVLGVSPGAAATAARIAIGGAVATRVRTDAGLVDVRVQLPAQWRNRLADIENIKLRANDGVSLYRLSDVASFTMAPAPTKIERLDKQRIVRVTAGFDPAVTTLGTVTDKINAAVNAPGFFPNGVALRADGDSQFFAETFSSMGIAMLTSFALVYVLMVILYSSFLTPFVIMFSVPLALVGALYGLALTHQTLNLFSLIGIIMLFGLVAKNGILLVDYANTQRRRGLRVLDAMRTAAGIRLRPIVMTTASMVFGMLPLALGLAEGAEFRRSMGTVLIGGLLSSLILTLFLVPVVYAWVAGSIERRADKRALASEHLPSPERTFA
jgi:HAE1 family hydrophobic/amphiphilic exporter-1